MSIASEITALGTNLAAAKNAITSMGGTVGNTGLAGLTTEIESIPSGDTPTEPAVPSGYYVVLDAYPAKLAIAEIEQVDPATAIASFRSLDNFDGTSMSTFALQAAFQEDPNTGFVYNLGFRWSSNNYQFELYYVDYNSVDQTLQTFAEWELQDYGIALSQTQFDSDTDIAHIRVEITPNVASLTKYYITEPSALNELVSPKEGSYDSYNVGETFIGLMDIDGYGSLVEKDFIVRINFGSESTLLVSIGDNFMRGASMLVGVHNLPSTISSIGNYFLSGTSLKEYFALPSSLTTVGSHFMSSCTVFNQPLDISHLTSIAGNFMDSCTSFNQRLTLNNSVSIGSNFLESCYSYNQPITIPASAALGTGTTYHFMYNCHKMTSTVTIDAPASVIGNSDYIFSTTSSSADCYTTGITLAGQYGSAWQSKLPNKTTSPYRKLLPSITLSKASLAVGVGYTGSLSITFSPDTMSHEGTWSSSDTSVVTVNQSGVVTGVSAGSATVTFVTVDGYSASCAVTSSVVWGVVEQSSGDTALIKNQTDVNKLYFAAGHYSVTVNGVTVTNTKVTNVELTSTSITQLPNSFLASCSNLVGLILPNSITNIGSDFLSGCEKFNQPLNLSNVTAVGNNFLADCKAFNQSLTFGSLLSVGSNFMTNCEVFNQSLDVSTVTFFASNFLYACKAFNQSLDVSSATSIGINFVRDCDNMTSTIYVGSVPISVMSSTSGALSTQNQFAACYRTGITLSGSTAAGWAAALPDSNNSPYRKLIVQS